MRGEIQGYIYQSYFSNDIEKHYWVSCIPAYSCKIIAGYARNKRLQQMRTP